MHHFLKDNHGATAIEYAMIIAVVILVMLGGLTILGGKTTSHFENVADDVEESM